MNSINWSKIEAKHWPLSHRLSRESKDNCEEKKAVEMGKENPMDFLLLLLIEADKHCITSLRQQG